MNLQEKYDEAARLINVSETYLIDGAPATAADRLRKAADLCQEIAEDRQAILSSIQTEATA